MDTVRPSPQMALPLGGRQGVRSPVPLRPLLRAPRVGGAPPSSAAGARSAGDRRVSRPGGATRHADGSTQHDRVLCLDIETVVDEALLPSGWPEDRFPKPIWHRVVAISYVQARIEREAGHEGSRYTVEACRSGGEPGWDEEMLLRGFWAHFERHRFQVVTWNGRAFDMQVLLQRAMMHGIPTPAWHTRGQGRMSYAQRYADWHVDLMDVISGYGASARLGLDEACAALGLPGKPGTSGADVAGLVAAGDLGRVRDYCESDALNTYALFLRYGFAWGRMNAAQHDAAVDDLTGHLAAERTERPHLGSFLDTWRQSSIPSALYVSNVRRDKGRKAPPADPCVSHSGSPFQGVFSAPPMGGDGVGASGAGVAPPSR